MATPNKDQPSTPPQGNRGRSTESVARLRHEPNHLLDYFKLFKVYVVDPLLQLYQNANPLQRILGLCVLIPAVLTILTMTMFLVPLALLACMLLYARAYGKEKAKNDLKDVYERSPLPSYVESLNCKLSGAQPRIAEAIRQGRSFAEKVSFPFLDWREGAESIAQRRIHCRTLE